MYLTETKVQVAVEDGATVIVEVVEKGGQKVPQTLRASIQVEERRNGEVLDVTPILMEIHTQTVKNLVTLAALGRVAVIVQRGQLGGQAQ